MIKNKILDLAKFSMATLFWGKGIFASREERISIKKKQKELKDEYNKYLINFRASKNI